MSDIPRMFHVQRQFSQPVLEDPSKRVRAPLFQSLREQNLPPGSRIGIAVGSRGIASISPIVDAMVETVREANLEPFLIPAMGSHGGATAEGQTQVLKSLGVDPDKLGVSCEASMETEILGTTSQGVEIFTAKAALAADGLLLCNRIKPHTTFCGNVQSGLLKMLTIGLGKHRGAATWHRHAAVETFDEVIREAVGQILQRIPLVGGFAIVENASKQLACLEFLKPDQFLEKEPELLQKAAQLMPRLPVEELDLLIVDEIGKEISGTGMDTNVIGRKHHDHEGTERDWCRVALIFVRGLTKATVGNANGIGLAEFTTPQVVEQVDWKKTGINAITAGQPTHAMCPLVLPSAQDVFQAVRQIRGERIKVAHIRNTGSLDSLYLSEAALEDFHDENAVVESGETYETEVLGSGD